MKVKDSMVLPASYQDIEDRITIIYDNEGAEFWSLNDLNKFIPSKRLDHFLANADIKEFIEALERSIIPGKSGIIAKRGKGGGTYAHRLIALRFASWLSKDFELAIYVAYDQTRPQHEAWSKERALTKYEYRLMTDAIKEHEAPKLPKDKQGIAYAVEAMLLNEIIFGKPKFDENPRLTATTEQLSYVTMLERYNATFIEMGLSIDERKVLLLNLYNKKKVRQLPDNNS